MNFLLLQTCFELFPASVSVSYHIAYEVLSSFYEVIVYFATTHTKERMNAIQNLSSGE